MADRIEIRDGQPVIAGTDFKVATIANMVVNHGVMMEQIANVHGLTTDQIHDAISYYYDHSEEVDRYIQENNEGNV